MTRDDIIRMARQVGYPIHHPEWQKATEEFAALVAAAEREACAALVEENAMACHSPIYRSLLQSNAQAIRERGKE